MSTIGSLGAVNLFLPFRITCVMWDTISPVNLSACMLKQQNHCPSVWPRKQRDRRGRNWVLALWRKHSWSSDGPSPNWTVEVALDLICFGHVHLIVCLVYLSGSKCETWLVVTSDLLSCFHMCFVLCSNPTLSSVWVKLLGGPLIWGSNGLHRLNVSTRDGSLAQNYSAMGSYWALLVLVPRWSRRNLF